jgi:HEAT repeat protein
MTEARIHELINQLEAASSLDRETAWVELKTLGETVVLYLADAYPKMKKREGRICCVFHSLRYARTSEAAFQLGISALNDRATLVRYRACQLLAYSLRNDAIPHLTKLLNHNDLPTVADARAAIDAINNQNHHYFVDRDHSGRSFWEVNPEDSKDAIPTKKKSWWQIAMGN